MIRPFFIVFLVLLGAAPVWAAADEPIDYNMITRIRTEGFLRSQVMETAAHLTEVIGPRLTNSPQMKAANEWTRDKLEEWGLENAALEPWGEFGRGWSFDRCTVHMVAPHHTPLTALPKAWTRGTDGPVTGKVMKVGISSEKDFEKYEGEIEGKILFVDNPRSVSIDDEPAFTRHDRVDLENIEIFPIPEDTSPGGRKRAIERWRFGKKLHEFYVKEKPLALVELSSRDAGVIRVGGSRSYAVGEDPGPPQLAMATEHFNRIVRLLDRDIEVELELDVSAEFHEDETISYNTVAEIPGAGKKREVVMLGAHLDSWHPGTGATDNASGCSVVMEAIRILKALDVKPKRTIRAILWAAEEQGLHGSRNYVKNHFASRPEHTDPDQLALPSYYRTPTWPIKTTREHENFSVYFNLDNGSGKIRGIYAQGNSAAAPIFEAWLKPFHDLEADAVTLRNTGSTDHISFDAVGLPGFQFIQDPLEYRTRTHHTNLDVYDRLQADDLKQASVIMASFVYHAAMRDDLFPRKPMPEPVPDEEDEDDEEEDDEES